MLLKPDPIDRLARKILKGKKRKDYFFIYMTPQGKPFSQSDAVDLSKKKHLVILCGHYEGVDERIRDIWVDSEVSIGDYVLTGGELPAMVILDASTRLIRGVIGNEESKNFESFSQNLIEYPQYTRPQIFRGHSVPGELLTGNHKKIDEWRHKQSLKRTKKRRPDLYSKDAHCARPNQERDRK
jgi:tRNA (guanine37-N1)-methyltransferase